MRTASILIVLASFASAEDTFPAVLEQFESALRDLHRADASDIVPAALERVIATEDARGVEPLARALAGTFDREGKLIEQIGTAAARGRKAQERLQTLGREIELLELRGRSGARGLGPELEKRKAEGRRLVQIAAEAEREGGQHGRTLALLLDLREKMAAGCATVTRGLEGAAAMKAFAALREILPVKDRERAPYLVRILRDSRRPEAVRSLADITIDEAASDTVVRLAASALARIPGTEPVEALLRLWGHDPDRYGSHVRHLLSRLAARPLADLEQARAWFEQQR